MSYQEMLLYDILLLPSFCGMYGAGIGVTVVEARAGKREKIMDWTSQLFSIRAD